MIDATSADRAIAKRLLDGDERAFKDVFDSFFPRLYRYALARLDGDREDARDVVQQTFCKAFERLETYRGEASLYGWMCRICRNTLIDHARRQNRQALHLSVTGADDAVEALVEAMRAPAGDEPDNRMTQLALLRVIQTTLDHLPAHYGDVLERKYVDEQSVKEIAAHLAIAPKAAESLLTRARNAFREAIVMVAESADLLPHDILATGKGLEK
jgi:RNA polymerase sigma-70 factor, ECF subfamily